MTAYQVKNDFQDVDVLINSSKKLPRTYYIMDCEFYHKKNGDLLGLRQISIIGFTNGRIDPKLKQFNYVIAPTVNEDRYYVHALKNHNITYKQLMQNQAPTVMKALLAFTNRYIKQPKIPLLGWGPSSDVMAIDLTLSANQKQSIATRGWQMDVININALWSNGFVTLSLEQTCERLGIPVTNMHNAYDDVVLINQVYWKYVQFKEGL